MIQKIFVSILFVCFSTAAFAQTNRDGSLPPSYPQSSPQRDVTPYDSDTSTHKHHWFDPKKIYFGMGGGLTFGTYSYVELEPRVGYRFTQDFSAGLGLTYIYSSGVNDYYDPNTGLLTYSSTYSSTIYGGQVFAQHKIYNNFVGLGEFEVLNAPAYNYDLTSGNFVPTRINVPSLFAGIGYKQPITGRAAFTIYLMYNLIYNTNTTSWIYPSPLVFQAGFTF